MKQLVLCHQEGRFLRNLLFMVTLTFCVGASLLVSYAQQSSQPSSVAAGTKGAVHGTIHTSPTDLSPWQVNPPVLPPRHFGYSW
jgi:hypothetical protein